MEARPIELTVLFDPREEDWRSMDLVGDMLVERWSRETDEVRVVSVHPEMPRVARRMMGSTSSRAFNADRMITRLVAYPAKARRIARSEGFFHIVDHSYAQLVHALPRARTGVYCHDLDAFRLNLEGTSDSRALPTARTVAVRALGRLALEGVRRAAVVFHSTFVVRDALLRHGVVPEARLVHAPYGVASEFVGAFEQEEPLPELLRGVPYVLHVGSGIARKRLDVLFDVCARSRRRWPELRLVQQGAELSPSHRAQLRELGLEHVVIQLPKLDRKRWPRSIVARGRFSSPANPRASAYPSSKRWRVERRSSPAYPGAARGW